MNLIAVINKTVEGEKTMDDMNPVFLPMLVTDRWNEAVGKKTDIRVWRACAYLAGLEADAIEKHDPDNVLVPALRGIADDAHARYLALMPRRA